ncbi:MAG: RNA polymerase sigma-70 factor [Sphingomonadales bacterium]
MSDKQNQFHALYTRFRPGLSSFASSIVKSAEDADEIVNDVFVSIWEKRHSLILDDSLKNYLFTAVKNRCLNHIKKAKLPFAEMPDEFTPASTAPSADHILEGKELQNRITLLIEQLPTKCKQVFLLSRMFDLSYKEIAEIMDISTKTVENQIGIALKFLKENTGRRPQAG